MSSDSGDGGSARPQSTPEKTVADYLDRLVSERRVVTYQTAAREIGVPAPHAIHKLTGVLEGLIVQDVADGRYIRAALVVSRARRGACGPIPAPGFFDAARAAGASVGSDPSLFHAAQIRGLLGISADQLDEK